jgi:hypothetical protein
MRIFEPYNEGETFGYKGKNVAFSLWLRREAGLPNAQRGSVSSALRIEAVQLLIDI